MSELTNYIKERIEELQDGCILQEDHALIFNYSCQIIALQAVLSKIEELTK